MAWLQPFSSNPPNLALCRFKWGNRRGIAIWRRTVSLIMARRYGSRWVSGLVIGSDSIDHSVVSTAAVFHFTRVDLLGDEVDTLLTLLGKIYIALDHYSPVLKHYPGVMETLKLVRRELGNQKLA